MKNISVRESCIESYFYLTLMSLFLFALPAASKGIGMARLAVRDQFKTEKKAQWEAQTHVFNCNETQFNPSNVKMNTNVGELNLTINGTAFGNRDLSGAEVRYSMPLPKVSSYADQESLKQGRFSYGHFSALVKTSAFPGTVSSMFLYRNNPWQEIDIEFLGSQPRKIQFNVYFNKGKEGDPNNDYRLDSPVQYDLPFDSSEDFHEYSFDWTPTSIRWYVDGKLMHEQNDPEKVPSLPLTLRMNHWGVCKDAAGWAGKPLDVEGLHKGQEATVKYKDVKVWQY